MPPQLVMGFVMIPLHGGVFQRPVHSFDLAVGPRVIRLREPVIDAVFIADAVKQVHEGMPVCFAMRELDAIIGKYRVQVIRYDVDQITQEVRGYAPCLPLMQLGISKLRGPVDGNEQVQFAFFRMHLGNVDVEVADRVLLEGFLFGLLTYVRQPTDTMPLEATMQGRPGQVRNGWLQGI